MKQWENEEKHERHRDVPERFTERSKNDSPPWIGKPKAHFELLIRTEEGLASSGRLRGMTLSTYEASWDISLKKVGAVVGYREIDVGSELRREKTRLKNQARELAQRHARELEDFRRRSEEDLKRVSG